MKPIAHPARADRGFTLIEVLVSLFILALMAGMAWQGVDMVVRSRETVQARMDGLLRLQSVTGQWEADLGNVLDTQQVPGLNFDGATLRLTRRFEDGVQVVAWTLRGGRLQRWTSSTLRDAETLQDGWLRSYQLLGNEPGTLTLLERVATMQVYVFLSSSNAWSNAQSSGDVATNGGATNGGSSGDGNKAKPATGLREALPDGVRLLLKFGEGATHAGTLQRDIRLVHP
ncbi:PulJ/GspJ family protein [Leptothrix discophora]|uniref:Prepilin-type N-terminal cleavage/methylation domain-containing protein n=1 Tax=Leptothrix discophora TaxID=89 RepID=A0ABT9G5Z8_LEPDI|nr:prepilin-type N-terminal cleavage/methylation domain-containing protein [Leptothrix discophora]MDP4301915.1 prepilin-type N-terminal cleavage/methylation domain-containing protein [Leptothrix discophora]